MKKRTTPLIMQEIIGVLKKEKELSIKQISLKLNSQWATTHKALQNMKSLGLVKERTENAHKKTPRLFSLAIQIV